MTWQFFSQYYTLEKLLHICSRRWVQKLSLFLTGKQWETLQMVKLIMVTSYNTTAYLPIVRERVRNIPGGHCAALQDSSEGTPLCFRPLLRQRRPLGRLHHSLASFPLSSKVHPTLPGYHLETTPQHTPYELICDSEFAAQGSLLRPSLTSLTLLL